MPSPFGDQRALDAEPSREAAKKRPDRTKARKEPATQGGPRRAGAPDDQRKDRSSRNDRSPAGTKSGRTPPKRSTRAAKTPVVRVGNSSDRSSGPVSEQQREDLADELSAHLQVVAAEDRQRPPSAEALVTSDERVPIHGGSPWPLVESTSGLRAPTNEGLSLVDYRDAILRRKAVFVAVLGLVMALALVYNQSRTDTFAATTRVVLQTTAAEQTVDRAFVNPAYAGRALSNEIKIANSDEVISTAGPLVTDAELIEVAADGDADVLVFTVTALDPVEAADGANRWASTYLGAKRQNSVDSIEAATTVLREQLARLRTERTELLETTGVNALIDDLAGEADPAEVAAIQRRIDRAQLSIEPELAALDAERNAVATAISELNISGQLAGVGTARILERATPPEAPVGMALPQLVVLSAIAGALISLASVVILERSDQRILSQRDARQATGLPLLGAVSRPKGMDRSVAPEQAARLHPGSGIAEAYHALGQSIRFAALGGDMSSLLVTSSGPGEGKTTTSVNLAWVLSSSGLDVILVDLDLRKPRVHSIYDQELVRGFAELAAGDATMKQVLRTPDSRRPNLKVLSAGDPPADVASFLHTDRAKSALAELGRRADLVIIDSPPALPVSDASILASGVDGAVVVARAGKTSGEDLTQCVANLQLAGGRVLGTVLTGVTSQRKSYGNVPYGASTKTRFGRDRTSAEASR